MLLPYITNKQTSMSPQRQRKYNEAIDQYSTLNSTVVYNNTKNHYIKNPINGNSEWNDKRNEIINTYIDKDYYLNSFSNSKQAFEMSNSGNQNRKEHEYQDRVTHNLNKANSNFTTNERRLHFVYKDTGIQTGLDAKKPLYSDSSNLTNMKQIDYDKIRKLNQMKGLKAILLKQMEEKRSILYIIFSKKNTREY